MVFGPSVDQMGKSFGPPVSLCSCSLTFDAELPHSKPHVVPPPLPPPVSPLFLPLSSPCVSPSPQYRCSLCHGSSSAASLSFLSRRPHIRNLNNVPCSARPRTPSAQVSSRKIPTANSSVSQSTPRRRIRSSVRTLWEIRSCDP